MLDQARVYDCPRCGAPNSELSRRCEYCDAPLASQRCAECWTMNAPEARHCAQCGSELAPNESISEGSARTCPQCRTPLDAVSASRRSLLDCARCGGQFVTHMHLRELLEHRDRLGRALTQKLRPENPLEQPIVYRPCPTCAALMNRKNFGMASGIIVDVCALHGIWFDGGELAGVLRFVASGGLERQRHSDAERRALDRVRSLELSSAEDVEVDLDFARAVHALFDFVVGWCKRLR